jgi:hypothetical protein
MCTGTSMPAFVIASQPDRRKAPPDDRLREAIQTARATGKTDCFAASLLAMTGITG